MAMHVSTDKEANVSLDASQSLSCSNTDISMCDSDGLPVSYEKKTMALLSNDKVDSDEHEFAATNVHQTSSSSNLDLAQPVLYNVKEHANLTGPTAIVLNDHNEVTDNSLNHSAVWVTFDRCSLLVSDRITIETGKQLSDKHINLAQRMIKNQFPSVGGLKSTLLQMTKVKGQRTANSIQIVHCKKREHWIVVSTKWSKSSQVMVYDSVFTKLDAESRSTILRMFGLKNSSDIVMVPMQQQSGGTDCGVFAIAVMTSLVFNDDPSEITYQQASLRSHLVKCFSSGELTTFPSV